MVDVGWGDKDASADEGAAADDDTADGRSREVAVDWTAEDDVMADEDASAVKVVAVTVAVIRTIEHENVVEWGTADEVVSLSHSQSSSPSSHSAPAVVVDALAVVADLGTLVAGAERGRRRGRHKGHGRVRRRLGDGGAGGDGGRPGRGGGGRHRT
jgi:hypothetical protein